MKIYNTTRGLLVEHEGHAYPLTETALDDLVAAHDLHAARRT